MSPEERKKGNARAQVARALKEGVLTRMPCDKCGAVNTVGHHEDYDKPLIVQWLCRSCHHWHHYPNGRAYTTIKERVTIRTPSDKTKINDLLRQYAALNRIAEKNNHIIAKVRLCVPLTKTVDKGEKRV